MKNLSEYLTEYHISKMNHDHGNLLNSTRMKLVDILGELGVLDSIFHQNLSSWFQFLNHSKVIAHYDLLIHWNLLAFSTPPSMSWLQLLHMMVWKISDHNCRGVQMAHEDREFAWRPGLFWGQQVHTTVDCFCEHWGRGTFKMYVGLSILTENKDGWMINSWKKFY